MSENMRLVTESRWLELLKIERQLERLRAAIPKRITSWGQAWAEGEHGQAHSPIDGWNACVDAFEAGMKAGE